MKKILFINASPRRNGNTARMAAEVIGNHDYQTLTLADYRINSYGSNLDGDELDQIVKAMKQADGLVIGSPVYWHNLAGILRVVMDRFYGWIDDGTFQGRDLFVIYQGAAPTDWMLHDGEYSLQRFATMYGFNWKGVATSDEEAGRLHTVFEEIL